MDVEAKEHSLASYKCSLAESEELLGRLGKNMGGAVGAWHGQITDLLQQVKEMTLTLDMKTERVEVNVHTAAYRDFERMLANSFDIVTRSTDKWTCEVCHDHNVSGMIVCRKCKSFRPLESYPNIIHSPENVTEIELEELNKRRKMELEMLTAKDQIEISQVFYLINCNWISEWKAFIFNKSSLNETQQSSNEHIGTLPPGPITNNELFTEPENP
jgi:hypothetical protein